MSISDVVCTCGYAAKPERDSMGNALPCMRCWFDNDGSTEFMRGYNAGRAAGYAEAIEKAARTCERYFEPDESPTSKSISKAIRALAPASTTPRVDASRGEWRCRCKSDPKFDTSINPSHVVRCTKCGCERP